MDFGKVWLVGAGPGDPELLTLRARDLLAFADVVVHDALVTPEILVFIAESAERIDVGKRRGKKRAEQEEIHALLVDRARKGKRVVRLKGGDPVLFGRAGEEMEALREAGIPYEVVPGVTAASAAAAMAGIPLTHRDVAGAVTVVTGHDAADTKRRAVSWHRLAGTDHTLVVYMGLDRLGEIAATLVAEGRPPETPVAVVQEASTSRERVVVGNLEDIALRVTDAGIVAPATVIVGPVAALHRTLDWKKRE